MARCHFPLFCSPFLSRLEMRFVKELEEMDQDANGLWRGRSLMMELASLRNERSSEIVLIKQCPFSSAICIYFNKIYILNTNQFVSHARIPSIYLYENWQKNWSKSILEKKWKYWWDFISGTVSSVSCSLSFAFLSH